MRSHPALWLGLIGIVGLVDLALAADQAADTGSEGLTEIVVTAQRRSESSQNVPVAIQAFDPAALKAMGVTSTDDLPEMVPGMILQPTGASKPIFLRGVGIITTQMWAPRCSSSSMASITPTRRATFRITMSQAWKSTRVHKALCSDAMPLAA